MKLQDHPDWRRVSVASVSVRRVGHYWIQSTEPNPVPKKPQRAVNYNMTLQNALGSAEHLPLVGGSRRVGGLRRRILQRPYDGGAGRLFPPSTSLLHGRSFPSRAVGSGVPNWRWGVSCHCHCRCHGNSRQLLHNSS